MSDLRERVARALLVSFYTRDAWNSVVEAERETFRHHADAALTVALEEAARRLDREWPGPASSIVRGLIPKAPESP